MSMRPRLQYRQRAIKVLVEKRRAPSHERGMCGREIGRWIWISSERMPAERAR